MVARYRPGAKIANTGSFKKNDKKSVDRRKGNGRPPGALNIFTKSIRERALAGFDDPNAPHSHFQKSFAQRRQQIVGDCLQLKTDVDVYNDKVRAAPIQIPLDFTLDVEELQQPLRKAA